MDGEKGEVMWKEPGPPRLKKKRTNHLWNYSRKVPLEGTGKFEKATGNKAEINIPKSRGQNRAWGGIHKERTCEKVGASEQQRVGTRIGNKSNRIPRRSSVPPA